MTTKEMSDFLDGLWCWARCTEEEQRKLSEIADYLSNRGNEKNDCISRKRAIERLKLNLPISDGADNSKDRYRYMQSLADIQAIRELPSVTPQEPKCKDCKWWKDSDGKYRRGCGAESRCPMNTNDVYCGDGYCYMFSPKSDMREVEE